MCITAQLAPICRNRLRTSLIIPGGRISKSALQESTSGYGTEETQTDARGSASSCMVIGNYPVAASARGPSLQGGTARWSVGNAAIHA